MNILIVDDSKLLRTVLKGMLFNMGFSDIYEATNGWEAIRKTYMVNPDIIFMNLIMPEMDGFEASKQILESFQDSKIVLVSADNYSEIQYNISEINIYDFITLPLQQKRLKKIMKEYESYAEKAF